MSMIINVSAFPAIDRHQHYHTCPVCKKTVYENNEICRRKEDHTYCCYNHLQHLRDVWGFLDDMVDVYLDAEQRARLDQVWHPGT